MRTLVTALVLAFIVAVPSHRAAAQQKMLTFQLVLLEKGTVPIDARAKPTLEAHGAYMTKLGSEGTVIAAGPFTDGGEILGAALVRAATAERAKEIEADDPAVKGGLFTVEVLPFMSTDEGQFQPWPKDRVQETVYFGFLNSGPNRSQDKETAQRLQKEHIAYMEGQAKAGKLLVAGPFIDGGARRGLVIYRMESAAAAKAVAEADPMVQAGRLVVELHPWNIPKGTLR